MLRTRPTLGKSACLILLVLGALCVGISVRPQPEAGAAVREATPKEHFLSGSERSLPLLEEISATLKKIDARLAKIEKTLATAARQQDNAPR